MIEARDAVPMLEAVLNPLNTRLVGAWRLSGDLTVWHPDGSIEIKDRSKNIISGGENISSL